MKQSLPTKGRINPQLINKDINEYFVIPPDYILTGVISRFTIGKELMPAAATRNAIENFLSNNLLAGKVPAPVMSRIEAPLTLFTITLTTSGDVAAEQGGFSNFIIPGVFSILLALSIIFSSTYMLQGLGEEKENRLIEILLSSVSTRQLITGKVLAVAKLLRIYILMYGKNPDLREITRSLRS